MPTNEELCLIERARDGDEPALATLFEQHRQRLSNMIALRMDPRLRARCDASDVLQDAYLELVRRMPDYEYTRELPFFIWLRRITYGRLTDLHRKHLIARKRTAGLEIAFRPEPSCDFLASHMAGQFTSVHRHLVRAEVETKLHEVIEEMNEKDREVIALRYFEGLSTEETATVLGLTRSGVLKRFTRALGRLSQAVKGDPNLNSNA